MSQPAQAEDEEFTGSNLKESEESKTAEGGTSEAGDKGSEESDAKKESKKPDDAKSGESKTPTVGTDSRSSVREQTTLLKPLMNPASRYLRGFSGIRFGP